MDIPAVQNAEPRPAKENEQSLRASISEIISDLEHPFNVPIEMYLAFREPTVALPGAGDIESIDAFMNGIFEPVREGISQLIHASLGTTVLNASFNWACLLPMTIMPTVFIDIRQGTVADWADLEYRIREMLARVTSTLGLVIDVQFQIVN
jgi:hypothetical protein